jgi:hypothetical protein
MIRLHVDFNGLYEGEHNAVALNEAHVPPEVLVPGTRVILYEPDGDGYMECDAIVRHGKIWPWVGEVIGPIRYISDQAADPAT